jgi:shikimate kinase
MAGRTRFDLGVRDANLGISSAPQAVGVGICGTGPEVSSFSNNNDDFSRFIIAIWRMYGAFALLNENFVQVAARTYGD